MQSRAGEAENAKMPMRPRLAAKGEEMSFSAYVTTTLSTLLLSVSTLMASLEGTAVAVQTTTQWHPGNLTLVALPGNQKTVLHQGDCWGPCFSPDGGQVAFILTNGTSVQDGYIHIIDVDGTGLENTRIPVRIGDDCYHKSGGTALYWLDLNGREYFYWASKYNGGGWFRCRRGTTTVEHVLYGDGAGFWGGVDRSGIYASGTGWDWAPRKCNLASGEWSVMTGANGGCNTSVSPNGDFVLHNLNTGYWSGTKHTHAMVRRWSDNSEIKLIASNGGQFDNHRWSHHSMDVVMWRHYTEGTGVVCNHVTDERISIGGFVAYDYYPGQLGSVDFRYIEPVFSPAGGVLPDGLGDVSVTSASAGVSIRYTLDGSDPTATNGIALDNGGQIPISIEPGKSLTVKAVAFRAGSDTLPSIVAVTTFSAPEEIPLLVLTSPEAASMYMVGQTLPVRWAMRPGAGIERIDVMISFDAGEGWVEGMNTETIDASTGQFDWVIPSEMRGVETHSSQVMVRIEVYGAPEIFSETGIFSIRHPDKAPLKSFGTPIVSVIQPTGSGSRDIDIIRDDICPAAGSGFEAAYDTYTGQHQTEAWFGYEFDQRVVFSSLTYQFGRVGDFGGQFTQMRVQVRDTTGSWHFVEQVISEPAYDAASVSDFGVYVVRFAASTGTAIRVIGAPINNEWVGCAELEVEGQAVSTGQTSRPQASANSGLYAPAVSLRRVAGVCHLVLRQGSVEPRLQIMLIDALGRMVTRSAIDHDGRVSTLPLGRNLQPGLYTLILGGADGSVHRRSVFAR